eukprot:TRINITY_DN2089_c0_g1_i1.p1 TRINITY_DN2089_c0_g1~~TRINITY_DN2089_c0_g1_i1.p1  ORF type:complete len:443 (+),score=111.16 TRINITY_DN2089_c0_g1_i1:26-1354(+)
MDQSREKNQTSTSYNQYRGAKEVINLSSTSGHARFFENIVTGGLKQEPDSLLPSGDHIRDLLPPIGYSNSGISSVCDVFFMSFRPKFETADVATALTFTPDCSFIVIGQQDGHMMVWRASDFAFSTVLVITSSEQSGTNRIITGMEWTHDNLFMMSCEKSGLLKVFDLALGNIHVIRHLYDTQYGANDLSFSPTDRYVAIAASKQKAVIILDFRAEDFVEYKEVGQRTNDDKGNNFKLQGKHDYFAIETSSVINSLQWHPESSLIACGSDDGKMMLIDPRQRRVVHVWVAHKKKISKIMWDKKSPLQICSASVDGFFKVWNIKDLSRPIETIDVDYAIHDFDIHPIHHDYVAFGTSYSIHNAKSNSYESQPLHYLRSSPNKPIIKPLQAKFRHKDEIKKIAFHPEGIYLITCSGEHDKKIHVWVRGRPNKDDTKRMDHSQMM